MFNKQNKKYQRLKVRNKLNMLKQFREENLESKKFGNASNREIKWEYIEMEQSNKNKKLFNNFY